MPLLFRFLFPLFSSVICLLRETKGGNSVKKCHTSTYPPSYLLRFDYLSNNVSFMISHWQSFEYSSLRLRSVHGQALKRNSVEFENVRLIKVSILKVGLLRVSSNALLSRVIQITRGQSNAASLASVHSPSLPSDQSQTDLASILWSFDYFCPERNFSLSPSDCRSRVHFSLPTDQSCPQ